jgi:hypothetical protein
MWTLFSIKISNIIHQLGSYEGKKCVHKKKKEVITSIMSVIRENNNRQRNIILLFYLSPFDIQPAAQTDSQHVYRGRLFSIPNFNYFKSLCIFYFLSFS